MTAKYAYAVARVRVKELSLLSRKEAEQLLSCRTYTEALDFLKNRGFGSTAKDNTIAALIDTERAATWSFLHEIVKDAPVLNLFLYENDFHNLKAAIKAHQAGIEPDGIFYPEGTVPQMHIWKAIRDKNYSALPAHLHKAAAAAVDILFKTNDGQECDLIIDKSAMQTILKAGRQSECDLVRQYAELFVALADIKLAARCCRTKKSPAFLNRALADCENLDVNTLAAAASQGVDMLYQYLETTAYADSVPELKQSITAFEKWCDNRIIKCISDQKRNAFTIAPVIAYLLAKENELKVVRIILSGKQNSLNEAVIRERVRMLYV